MENIIDIEDLNGREVAVGEKIRVNGVVYECVEDKGCRGCAFVMRICPYISCSNCIRKDGKNVVFVKREQMETNENKKFDISEILEKCPTGISLYSPIFGEVRYIGLKGAGIIQVKKNEIDEYNFYYDGRYDDKGECMLFPSKDQRDWSKFKLPVKPPFEVKMDENDEYYYVDDLGEVQNVVNNEYSWRDSRYSIGNYFNTIEQAEYVRDRVRELMLSLRKEGK